MNLRRSIAVLLLLLPLAAVAEDNLAVKFRDAKGSIITQMRSKPPEMRLAAVRRVAAFPVPDAATFLIEQGMASPDEVVRRASFETLLEFKDNAEICSFLKDEVGKDLKRTKLDTGTPASLGLLLSSKDPAIQEAVKGIFEQANKASTGRLLVVSLTDLLGSAADDASLESLLKLRELSPFESEFGPRRAVVQALINIRKPAAVTCLVEMLISAEGEIRADILTHLMNISGESFDSPEKWQEWWEKNKEKFEFPPKENPRLAAVVNAAVPNYYGIPLYGGKIVFVLDTSTSMRGGRIEAAQRELIRAIGDLPDGTSFNIVAFNSRVFPWQRKLVPATQKSKNDAAKFVLERQLGNGTASYDALEAALTFETEAIYFLTDGAPVGGKITRPAEIVSVIGNNNRVRRLTINAIGVGVGPEGNVFDTFLSTLSKQNFGAYRRVDN
jgi:hypothetical protein